MCVCVCVCVCTCAQVSGAEALAAKVRGLPNVSISHIKITPHVFQLARSNHLAALRAALTILRALPCAPERLSVLNWACDTEEIEQLRREPQWEHVSIWDDY